MAVPPNPLFGALRVVTKRRSGLRDGHLRPISFWLCNTPVLEIADCSASRLILVLDAGSSRLGCEKYQVHAFWKDITYEAAASLAHTTESFGLGDADALHGAHVVTWSKVRGCR